MTTPADYARQAVADSLAADDTVTIEHTTEIAEELELICAGSVDAGADMDQVEFWGTDAAGHHWRVHLVGVAESLEIEAADEAAQAEESDGQGCPSCGFVAVHGDTCVNCGVSL